MLLLSGTGDQDVVKVNKCAGEVAEGAVHKALESLRSIFETEEHPQKFEEPERHDDGGFRNAGGLHRYVVIAAIEIHLGEPLGANEPISKCLDVRERVPVGHGKLVEATEITTGAPGTIGLRHHV